MSMATIDQIRNTSWGTKLYISPQKMQFWGTILFLVLTVFAIATATFIIDARKELIISHANKRVEILAQNKADLLGSYFAGLDNLGKHITESDAIRLFAAEKKFVDSQKMAALKTPIQKQAPYLKTVLDDFARKHDAVQTMIVSLSGTIYLSAFPIYPLSDGDKERLQTLAKTELSETELSGATKTQFSPIYLIDGKPLVTLLRPIFELGMGDQKPVAALMTTFDLSDMLSRHLAPGPLALDGEKPYVLQKRDGLIEYLNFMGDAPTLDDIKGIFTAKEMDLKIPLKRYVSPFSGTLVYGATASLSGTPFMIAHEYREDAALADFYRYRVKVYAITILAVFILSLTFIVVTFYILGLRNKYRVTHQQQMLNALVRAVEIRDPYLSGHHERVARLALKIGNDMRLSTAERATLYYGAMLCGVGKIFVPQKILNKPGKLTGKERETLQEHLIYAAHVFEEVQFDLPIPEVINAMYERVDGSGYPNGKSGSDIPLLSRILAVCDVYCALVTPRAYRQEMSVEEALEVIGKESEKFDKGALGVLKERVSEADVSK